MAAAVASSLPFERFPIDLDFTEEFLKKSENAPKETPENRAQKLQELLRLINDTPDLVTRTDEAHLLRFLRAKYFHVNYAFQQIKNYEEYKTKYPEWLNVNLPIVKQLTCNGTIQVLPTRDQHGRRIIYIQGASWKPTVCPPESVLQVGALGGDASILEPMTQVAGIVMVFNLKDVGMTQVKGVSAGFAKKMVYFLAHCLPVRIDSIHIIHEPSVFSILFALFKVFLTDRMKKRMHFHGSNLQSLHQHITPSCLPPECGGTFSDLDPIQWYNALTDDLIKHELESLGYKFSEGESDVVKK